MLMIDDGDDKDIVTMMYLCIYVYLYTVSFLMNWIMVAIKVMMMMMLIMIMILMVIIDDDDDDNNRWWS